MMNCKRLLLGSTVVLSLLATPAIAQEVSEWDQDGDNALSEQEVRTGFESAGIFSDWDADGDGALSEEEFTAGIGEDSEAFGERFGESAYSEWDEDGDAALSEDEFYGGVYAGYDDDGNQVIEEPELSDLGDDMGDAGFWDV